jgi:hypothetical protein
LHELLDGPIDLDKLDYIERDAHHCGVPYGSYIDIARIIETMRVIEDQGAGGAPALAFDERIVGSLEQFATARHELYANVYWHRAVRSATVMFKHAFYLFQQLIADRQELEDLFYKTIADDCLLYRMYQLTEGILRKRNQKPATEKKARAVLALLGAISGMGERILYKPVLERNREGNLEGDENSYETDSQFGGKRYVEQRTEARRVFSGLKRKGFLTASATELGEHNVLIDCHTDSFPHFETIRLIKGLGNDPQRLGQLAPSIAQLRANFKRQACKIRVFINAEALREEFREKSGRREVTKYLEEVYPVKSA